MKTKFIYLILLSLFAVSCSKNDRALIEAANETAAGQYQYLSIIWKGKAVDLNGDGVLNRDIIKEYEGSLNLKNQESYTLLKHLAGSKLY